MYYDTNSHLTLSQTMQLTLATATLFAALSLNAGLSAGSGSCNRPALVEAFASTVYKNLTLYTESRILDELELSGGAAALVLYTTIKTFLDGYGFCNAERVAFTGSVPLTNVQTETIRHYFDQATRAFGGVLFQNGLLNCENSVSMGLNLSAYIRGVLRGLDESKYESQVQAVVQGAAYFFYGLGLKLQDVTQETADRFAEQFKDKCNTNPSSD